MTVFRITLAFALWSFVSALASQERARVVQASVPPLSWTCPMHPDVVDSDEGSCPICKMKLVPVRLESVWTCPIHSVIEKSQPGKCPIDGRDLIRVTMALSWTCAAHPEIDRSQPGTCPDGTPMIAKHSPRPHGNHNPQHGGQFFMAPDNSHHLEGVYPRPGTVRIYLYDDYTRPLSTAQARLVTGRIVTEETLGAATRTTDEIVAFPLVLARSGRYLEAKVGMRPLPAAISAKIKFKEEGPEYRFDFTFAELSKEPRSTAQPAVSPSGASRLPETATSATSAITIDPTVLSAPIPDSVDGILRLLETERAEIYDRIQRGAFPDVYLRAFQAKDLALALDTRAADLPAERRVLVDSAAKEIVVSAWLIDLYGDQGNRAQLAGVYETFAGALAELNRIYASGR